jgi:Ca-activated chloride channel family protein
VDWGKLEPDLVAPCDVPPLFRGDRVTVYARLRCGSPSEVAIEATGAAGKVRFPLFVDLEKAVVSRAVPALMARRAIDDLEAGAGTSVRGSRQTARRQRGVKEKVVALAKRYGLLSSHTSYVAVEERDATAAVEPAELRRIPVALTQGWGGLEYLSRAKSLSSDSGVRRVPMLGPSDDDEVLSASLSSRSRARTDLFSHFRGGRPTASSVSRMRNDKDALELLISSQRADGSFDLTDELARLAGRDLKRFRRTLRKAAPDAGLCERLFATVLALKILEVRFAQRRDEWRLLADKAQSWLEGLKAKGVAIPAELERLAKLLAIEPS